MTTSNQPAIHPSTRVVEHVAEHTGVDPLELEPLYDAIDPDALDQLFSRAGGMTGVCTLEFSYAGYLVTVAVGDGDTPDISVAELGTASGGQTEAAESVGE